jgi:hypothetical protein
MANLAALDNANNQGKTQKRRRTISNIAEHDYANDQSKSKKQRVTAEITSTRQQHRDPLIQLSNLHGSPFPHTLPTSARLFPLTMANLAALDDANKQGKMQKRRVTTPNIAGHDYANDQSKSKKQRVTDKQTSPDLSEDTNSNHSNDDDDTGSVINTGHHEEVSWLPDFTSCYSISGKLD